MKEKHDAIKFPRPHAFRSSRGGTNNNNTTAAKKNGDLFQSNSCVILAQGPCYRSNRVNIDCAMSDELRNVVPNLLCIFIRLTNAIAEAMAINEGLIQYTYFFLHLELQKKLTKHLLFLL